jgi:serine/threonine protein kinase
MAGIEGLTLGRYELRRRIAQGGMAEVYVAYDRRVRRQVAIKVLYGRDEAFVRRFEREALAVGALTHNNILPLYDFGEQSPWYYLVMPYVEGGTLRDYLAQRHIITLDEAASIIDQISSALEHAHTHNVVHRDVKPSNVLLRPDGYAYLVDFGLAKALTGAISLTNEGAMIGTPEYMAPEQSNGESDYRSDIYSLGVILYQMLTGRVPFTAESPVAISLKHIQHTPPPPGTLNKTIPPSVEAIILKALEKEPQARYQHAQELSQAFWHALQQLYADQRDDGAVYTNTDHDDDSDDSDDNDRVGNETTASPIAEDMPIPNAITLVLEETRAALEEQKSKQTQKKIRSQLRPPLVPLRLPARGRASALAVAPLSTSLPPARRARRNRLLLAFMCLAILVVTLPIGLLAWQAGHTDRQGPAGQAQTPGSTTQPNQAWFTATGAAEATEQAILAAQARVQATAGITSSLGAGTVVYADDLTAPGGGWIDDGSQCYFSLRGYHVRTYAAQYYAWCYTSQHTYANVIITAQAQLLRGDTYGVIFRLNPLSRTFYVLEINSSGAYRFVLATGSDPLNWITLIDWTFSSAIQVGYRNTNTFLIVADGPQFRFYLNRQLIVTTFSDTTYTSGMIGFLVGGDNPGGTEAVFSNVWVFQK